MQKEMKTNVQGGNHHNVHVSSNGYYGYQAVPPKTQERESSVENMDFEHGNAGVQFNNYIATEDRLNDPQRDMRGPINRKRRWNDDDTPLVDFKKRREFEPISDLCSANRYVNSRQPTHNMPDLPRCLMGHFI